MPEGDSIKRLATQVGRAILGKTVRAFATHTIADDVARTIVGQTVIAVESRGKNLLVRFEDGRSLHVHLRMLGRVRVDDPKRVASRSAYRSSVRTRAGLPPRETAPQLLLAVDGAVVTGWRIPVLRLIDDRGEARAIRLGPDLLADRLDESAAARNLRAEGKRPIGEALLLQRALAGIGNIWKSETLFHERIDPRTPVAELEDAQLLALVHRASALLHASVQKGRVPFAVYDRKGKPCVRCRTPIEVVRQGAPPGRSTYHCPRCQR